MKRLPLLVPLGSREAPFDFLSRLAVRNCIPDMRTLGQDLGLDVQGVIDGNPDALKRLAEAGSAGLEALQREAFVCKNRREANTIFYRGHKFSRTIQLSRNEVRICPACLLEDVGRHGFCVDARPYRRAHWMLSQIRTCERHSLTLVSIGGMTATRFSLDTSLIIARALPSLSNLLADCVQREPSAFEKYVLSRLDNAPNERWVDSLSLHVAMQSSALLGASIIHGPLARLSDLSEDERWQADAIGFEALKEGERGLRAALAMIEAPKTGGSARGPKAMFGQIYDWLANATSDRDFDPVRDVVTAHVVANMPVGPGDRLFGKDITTRKIHSVWSASREYRIDRDRLRLMLIHGGWIERTSDVPFNWMTFDAVKAEPFLKNAQLALNYLQALKYLNAPKALEPILVSSGLLTPWIAAGASGLKDHAFLPRDLDAFLASLMASADERLNDDTDLMDISAAQKRVMCGAEAIIRLLMNGKLRRVAKRTSLTGFRSVLVDPSEIEPLVTKKHRDGLSLTEVGALLAAPITAVHAFVKADLLPTSPARHPKNNRPMKVVTRAAVDEFSANYVSLAEAARSAKVSVRQFRRRQTQQGVTPVFETRIVLYRRADLKPVVL